MLDAEKERRRKQYKFALVQWENGITAVESKNLLRMGWFDNGGYTILCDWEPERVLRGMLKLLKEDK